MTEVKNPVFDRIDQNHPGFVEKLRTLCQHPSVSAQNLGLRETATLVAGMLEEAGLRARLVHLSKGPPVVFAELGSKSGGRTLTMYNHYDVQPPEPLELWKHPPFSAVLENGRLYARGASDNKANIISRLMVLRSFLEAMDDVPCSIKWVIEGEEEVGSPHFQEFIENYRAQLSAQSGLWEFGGLDYDDIPLVTLGLKGMLYVEFKVQTAQKDTHSARAAIVESPAWRLVRLLNTIEDGAGRILVEGWYDDVRRFTDQELDAIKRMPFHEDKIMEDLGIRGFLGSLTGLELKKALLGNPTANIAGIWSGYTGPGHKTVLPAFAEAKIDFRLVPDQDPGNLAEKLRDHLRKKGFDDVEVKLQAENPAARTPIDSPIAQIAAKTAREIFLKEPAIAITSAGSGPMHFFTKTLGLPTVAIGCNHADNNAHAPNENQRIDVFVQGSKWIARVIEEFAKQPLGHPS